MYKSLEKYSETSIDKISIEEIIIWLSPNPFTQTPTPHHIYKSKIYKLIIYAITDYTFL